LQRIATIKGIRVPLSGGFNELTEKLPSAFIGSSTEGIDVAREVELQLQGVALTTIWKDDVFGLGSGTLDSLIRALDEYDFAIIILSPDDMIESKNKTMPHRETTFSSNRGCSWDGLAQAGPSSFTKRASI